MVPILEKYAELRKYSAAERIILEIADVLGDRDRFAAILKDKTWFRYMVPTVRKYAEAKGYAEAEKRLIFEMASLLGESFASELKEKAWPSHQAPLEQHLPSLSLFIDAFVHDMSLVDWNQLVHLDDDFKQGILPYMRKLRSSGVDPFLQMVRKIRKALIQWNPKRTIECVELCNDIVQKSMATPSGENSSDAARKDDAEAKQFLLHQLSPAFIWLAIFR